MLSVSARSWLFSVLLLPALASAGGNLQAVKQSMQAGRAHVPGELLVQLRGKSVV